MIRKCKDLRVVRGVRHHLCGYAAAQKLVSLSFSVLALWQARDRLRPSEWYIMRLWLLYGDAQARGGFVRDVVSIWMVERRYGERERECGEVREFMGKLNLDELGGGVF